MPTFFSFEQGSESRSRFPATDASPLLGRFRAVPNNTGPQQQSRRRGSLGLLSRASWRNSVHIGHGYGALLAAGLEDPSSSGDSDDDDDLMVDETEARLVRWLRRRWRRAVEDIWITPKQAAVRRIASSWWRRWLVLVVLPAALAVGWCAIPFPQYPLGDDEDWDGHNKPDGGGDGGRKMPGHGEAKVEVNFWFFLAVYYAFYNLTALIWITKVFNLYSLNWWPRALGFPLTICLIAVLAQGGAHRAVLRPGGAVPDHAQHDVDHMDVLHHGDAGHDRQLHPADQGAAPGPAPLIERDAAHLHVELVGGRGRPGREPRGARRRGRGPSATGGACVEPRRRAACWRRRGADGRRPAAVTRAGALARAVLPGELCAVCVVLHGAVYWAAGVRDRRGVC